LEALAGSRGETQAARRRAVVEVLSYKKRISRRGGRLNQLQSKIRDTVMGLVTVPVLHADDDSFLEPGGIGLWTKADAATMFDDLSVTSFEKGAGGER